MDRIHICDFSFRELKIITGTVLGATATQCKTIIEKLNKMERKNNNKKKKKKRKERRKKTHNVSLDGCLLVSGTSLLPFMAEKISIWREYETRK